MLLSKRFKDGDAALGLPAVNAEVRLADASGSVRADGGRVCVLVGDSAFTHWTARGPGHRALANAVVIDVPTRRSRSEFEGSASLANAHRCQAVLHV